MSGSSWSGEVNIEGRPDPAGELVISPWNRVGPDYFDTVGTRILRGRPITAADTAGTRHVAVVSEAFAKRFWRNEEPIGKHFGTSSPKYAGNFEVVGVAEDAKYRDPEAPVPTMFFLPRSQTTAYDDPATQAFETRSLYANDMVLRLAARDDSMPARIRQAFADIDPNLTVIFIRSFDTQLTNNVSQQTLIARLTSLFGLTALLLASIGLYGVTSYSVARRQKEIGIRVALGADRKMVLAMVLRHAYKLVAVGLLFGIPLTLAMGRIISSSLYGISGYNPLILGSATLALGAFALAATIVPARRAASLDPIETLRGD
jgi:predicted permease